METDLLDREAVSANDASTKGSRRPNFIGNPKRPRHTQTGWKNFRADTLEADPAHETQAFFQI
jgi:hypothetical protein